MSDPFDDLIGQVLAAEGGFVDDPRDAGGATNWGVTQAVARANGFTGDMRAMTRDQAEAIYRAVYWEGPGFDQLAAVSAPIAGFLFDTAVNMGVATAAKFLQRLLNVLNRNGQDFADVPLDGRAGPATRAALFAFLKKRPGGEALLLAALKGLRMARYVELAEQAAQNETFEFGWLQRAAGLGSS